jgi:hypothetical protein
MRRPGSTSMFLLTNPRRSIAAFAAILAIALVAPASAQQGQAAGRATNESGPLHSFILRTTLPLAREVFTRTIELADGENVVRITSDLEEPADCGPAHFLGRARHPWPSVYGEGQSRGRYAGY